MRTPWGSADEERSDKSSLLELGASTAGRSALKARDIPPSPLHTAKRLSSCLAFPMESQAVRPDGQASLSVPCHNLHSLRRSVKAYFIHMSQTPAIIQSHSTEDELAGWLRAYLRFLASREESFVLKVAPLALVGALPIDVVANLIPGIDILDDAGYMIILIVVLYKTLTRVNYYRRSTSRLTAAS